ncbi:DUF6510 family protein [Spirosoma koreense]
MLTETDTINEALRLDGNAIAGDLRMWLDFDATILQTTCSHCHKEGLFANLVAYVRGPGIVLRCPSCEGLIVQIVKRPKSVSILVEGNVAGLQNTEIYVNQ